MALNDRVGRHSEPDKDATKAVDHEPLVGAIRDIDVDDRRVRRCPAARHLSETRRKDVTYRLLEFVPLVGLE